MPPRQFSRFTFSEAAVDVDTGRLLLSEYEPFRFQTLSDNRTHVAADGDTLFTLAGHYFAPLPRPAGLYWILADFQPDPIVDPTIALVPGTTIWVPSLRTVQELIFSETRRADTVG